MRKVVANTTPLIALADVGQLELLHQLYGEILIPSAVLSEVLSEPAKTQVHTADWIKVIDIQNLTSKSLFSARLHLGEIEVILLAQEQEADLVLMDDNAAKKTAKFLGLNVTGTLGILIRSKKEGLITAVKPIMENLIADGLYVDDKTRKMVLQAACEE